MKLSYTTEKIVSPDGIECAVLDTKKIDFDQAVKGRKSAETLVREAKGGEKIQTKNTKGEIESEYIAKKGDAIFINLHNSNDIYVPGNPDGTRWQYSELPEKGYIIVAETKDGVRMKNGTEFSILHEAIEKPACIKNAWGPEQHQFLFKGATLKLNENGSITGIDKSAFDKTWEVVLKKQTKTAKFGLLAKTEEFNRELYQYLPMLLINSKKPPEVKGSYRTRPFGGLITDIDVPELIVATHHSVTRIKEILESLPGSPFTFLSFYCGFDVPWTIDVHGSCRYDGHAIKVWYENLKKNKLVPESLLKEIKHNLFASTISLSNLVKVRDLLKNYSRASWTEEAVKRGYTEFLGKKYTILDMLQKGNTCICTFLFRPASQKPEFCTIDVGYSDPRYQKETSILIEYYNDNIYGIFKAYKWFIDKKYFSEFVDAANSIDKYTSLKSRIATLDIAKNVLFPVEIDRARENIVATAKKLGIVGTLPEIQKKVQKEIEELCKKYIQKFRPKLFGKYRNEVAVYEIRAMESREKMERDKLKGMKDSTANSDNVLTGKSSACPFFEIPLPELQHLIDLAQRAQIPESALVQCVKNVSQSTGIDSFTLIRTLFNKEPIGHIVEQNKKYYKVDDEYIEINNKEDLRLTKLKILFGN